MFPNRVFWPDAVLGPTLLKWEAGDVISLRLTYLDTVGPAFVSAAATGNSLVLTFDETLDTASTPDASAFAVTVDGSDRTVTNVALSGSTATLTFSGAAITSGQAFTVSYAAPASGKLQDRYGNAAGDFAYPPLSTDATLRDLTLSGATLVPTFASGAYGYTASVANSDMETTVTPTLNDDGASYVIKLGGVVDEDGIIDLAVGENVITVEVTAEDTTSTQTYTVTATRAPDTTPPEVTITLDSEAPWLVQFEFSEPVTGFAEDDITVEEAEVWSLKPGSLTPDAAGEVFTVEIAPAPGFRGPLTVGIPAGAASDGAANPSPAASLLIADLDTGPAVLVYLEADTDSDGVPESSELRSGDFRARFVFIENGIFGDAVTDFDATDITVGNGSVVTDSLATDANSLMVNVTFDALIRPDTGCAPCDVTVDVAAGAAHDANGTPNVASETLTVRRYAAASTSATPHVASLAIHRDPNYLSYSVGIAFSEDIKGLEFGEIVLTNAAMRPLSSANQYYDFWLDAAAAGEVKIEIAASAYTDIGGAAPAAKFEYTFTAGEARSARAKGGAPAAKDAGAVTVSIPDAALRGIIERALNRQPGDPITNAEMADIVLLNLRGLGVADLTGLEHAVNLTDLYLDDSSLDLSPLSGLGVNIHVDGVIVRPAPPPLSTDATLRSLELSGAAFTFDPATTRYTAEVANEVAETTVTPTVNHDGATYAIKLEGVTDDDGTVPLAMGENVIAIEVTAEDGETAITYAVTVTRAKLPAPGPTATIDLSPSGSVVEGTAITVTTSFANLEFDSDTSDTDYIFRADVVDADECEGEGIGVERYMWQVDEDPEVRTGAISAACPVGEYTVAVSISSPDNVELASASASFSVVEPEPTDEPAPGSPPDVPDTPTGEVTGKGQVQLDWNDVAGAAYYQVRFCCGSTDWVELPTDGIEIVIDGSGATASNLPDYGFYYFSVRAGNAAGLSDWSDFLKLANPDQ